MIVTRHRTSTMNPRKPNTSVRGLNVRARITVQHSASHPDGGAHFIPARELNSRVGSEHCRNTDLLQVGPTSQCCPQVVSM